MWKTRFEMGTSNNSTFNRRRTSSSSSSSSPTVRRVREDSPSAILRPPSSSSTPNLESLIEEDEIDFPSTNFPSKTLPKQNSYQTMHKHRLNLPTIIESHDHEMLNESTNTLRNEFHGDKHDTHITHATNTNHNQLMNVHIERKLINGFTINQQKVCGTLFVLATSGCQ
ncbi:hypothetical protein I4U23_006387 [Adineta vaga]|nr:hypothetical protein I4U23_006387 [Adineta vaga]